MPLANSPPPPVVPPPTLAPVCIEPSVCRVCNETMVGGNDCLIIHQCSHPFHRSCIEDYMSTSSQCPTCKRACQLSDMRKLVISVTDIPIYKPTAHRGKGRVAISRQYNTRSASQNLFNNPGHNNSRKYSRRICAYSR